MLPIDTRLISVDDHLIEHPTVWQERLPQAMREQGPRVVELEGGAQQWCFEGVVAGSTGLSAVAGTPLKERGIDPRRFEDMRRGCWDPVARLDDMDEDGVAVQLPFPSYPGFAGSRFFRAVDKTLALECVRAYNDFVLEEWCAAAPDRYIGLVIVPFWDVPRAAEELQRCAAKGARAISFPDNPAPLGLPSFHTDHWDPFFAAVQDVGLPICMHFGTSGNTPHIADDAPLAVTTTLMGSTLFSSMVDLIMSPALHRFPGLRVCYSEGQIGWIPFALQRMDQVWEHYRFYRLERTINADVRPSDLFRKHIFGCFIDDEVGLAQRDCIGVENILWESDYPHADSLWPNSRATAEKLLSAVPDEDARKIGELNARALFHLS